MPATTPSASAVAAVEPMQVDRNPTSGGETSAGEVYILPVAIRAKGDKELQSGLAELRVMGPETEELRAMVVAMLTELPKSPGKVQARRG